MGNACRIRYERETQFVTLPRDDWDETDWRRDNATLLRQAVRGGRHRPVAGRPCSTPCPRRCPRPSTGTASTACCSAWRSATRWATPPRGCCRRSGASCTARSATTCRTGGARRSPRRPTTRSWPSGRSTRCWWTTGLYPGTWPSASPRSASSASARPCRRRWRRSASGYRPWYECGTRSAGNGALMRIAPMLVPYVRSPSPDLWVDTALSAIVTHNDAASTSACLAFVAMLWQLLGMDAPPEPSWWRRAYVAPARDLEGETEYAPRGGAFREYRGPLWRFVDERLAAAEAARPHGARGLRAVVVRRLPAGDRAERALHPRAPRRRPGGGARPRRQRHQGQRHHRRHRRRRGRRAARRRGAARALGQRSSAAAPASSTTARCSGSWRGRGSGGTPLLWRTPESRSSSLARHFASHHMMDERITRPRPIVTTITVRTPSSRCRLLERPCIHFADDRAQGLDPVHVRPHRVESQAARQTHYPCHPVCREQLHAQRPPGSSM